MFEADKKPKGLTRIYRATLNSIKAFKWLLKNEAAFRQELVLLIIAIPLTFTFDITVEEQIILILSILFVMFTEIVNTAIEAVVDRIGLEIHPLSGLAKDLGSAAVTLGLIMAVLVWVVVLI